MKDKAKTKAVATKVTTTKYLKNADELLTALSLSTVTGVGIWQGVIHRQENILWVGLLTAGLYAAFRAFGAWGKVLGK